MQIERPTSKFSGPFKGQLEDFGIIIEDKQTTRMVVLKVQSLASCIDT